MNSEPQKGPRLVYVAGPYRAPTRFGTEKNIHAAEALGVEVAKLGAYPVIPHSNTRGYFEDLAPGRFWLEATTELMRRCDAVILLPNWSESEGARQEEAEAKRLGIPVFPGLGMLAVWINGLGVPEEAEAKDTEPLEVPR